MTSQIIYIILIGFGIVAVFDALASYLSRKLKFSYGLMSLGSIIIYAQIAIFANRHSDIYKGVLVAFIIGLFDATIGLLISKYYKANMAPLSANEAFKLEVKTILKVSLLATVVGFIAIIAYGRFEA